ncbi:glycosyltransferase [bacterium]|nr:glycosyltransferase [bacterium]
MIRHSGIGVVLHNLLDRWAVDPPATRLMLLGDPTALARWKSPQVDLVRWTPGVYSLAAALFPPAMPHRPLAWYSPHYATCLRPGAPLVCHIQDVLHITHPTRRGTALYARLYLAALRRRASFVLTSSRHVKVQLQTLYRFRADRVLMTGLGPGFPATLGGELPPPLGLEGGKYLLAVGIFKPHKNWDFLLRRLVELGDRVPPLVAAGTGRGGSELARLAARRGYTRLTVAETLAEDHLAALFRGAAALTYPSVAEGFGLPLLEAMQVGTPVVAADRSPMKEIVGAGGWLFDPDRPESFDRALLAALQREPEHLAAAHQRAATFSWERTARVVAEALQRATA